MSKRGKNQKLQNILRAKHLYEAKLRMQGIAPPKEGDNFRFVCWGDVTELKLWRRPLTARSKGR